MAPQISFTPSEGKPGDSVFGNFIGFEPGETVKYTWPDINYLQYLQMNSAGELHGTVFIDVNRAPGTYEVLAVGLDSGQVAKTAFKVHAVVAQPPGTQEPGTDPVNVNFPVTVNSSKLDIMEAFRQSGYWSQLNAGQQARASFDPAAWLRGHPFLYGKWPAYFVNAKEKLPVDDSEPGGIILKQAGSWFMSNWFIAVLLVAFASLALAYVFYGAKIKKLVKDLAK